MTKDKMTREQNGLDMKKPGDEMTRGQNDQNEMIVEKMTKLHFVRTTLKPSRLL
jgi:hypothetical protein